MCLGNSKQLGIVGIQCVQRRKRKMQAQEGDESRDREASSRTFVLSYCLHLWSAPAPPIHHSRSSSDILSGFSQSRLPSFLWTLIIMHINFFHFHFLTWVAVWQNRNPRFVISKCDKLLVGNNLPSFSAKVTMSKQSVPSFSWTMASSWTAWSTLEAHESSVNCKLLKK